MVNGIFLRQGTPSSDDLQDGGCQVGRVSGRTPLVIHHIDTILFIHQSQHRLNEIMAMRRIDPGGADEDRCRVVLQSQLFAFEFGGAVNIQG